MLIDDVTIEAKAGRGGDGVVRFTKLMMSQGPSGGNGGHGGSVILKGVSDLGALKQFRNKKSVKAGSGKDGAQNKCDGKEGEDVIILVPVGTLAHDITNDKAYDITHVGQEVIVAKGGNGGFGNFHFRSSRNTTPMRANEGQIGEKIELRLELKLIADVGFVGLPNVGKSSLLNELTNASSKVANYKFTTLEPHLGVFYGLILADIPGLIEGAADGKGLGHKFLRHIERTKVIFHFIAADSEHPLKDYHTIRKELETFNNKMIDKDEWIIVSRSDEVDDEKLKEIIKELSKINEKVVSSSLLKDNGTDEVKRILSEIERNK